MGFYILVTICSANRRSVYGLQETQHVTRFVHICGDSVLFKMISFSSANTSCYKAECHPLSLLHLAIFQSVWPSAKGICLRCLCCSLARIESPIFHILLFQDEPCFSTSSFMEHTSQRAPLFRLGFTDCGHSLLWSVSWDLFVWFHLKWCFLLWFAFF